MDELDLLIRLRDEVPLAEPSAAAERAVLMAFRAGGLASRPAPRRRAGRQWLLGVVTAGVMAVASGLAAIAVNASPPTAQVIAWSGRPAAGLQNSGYPSVGRARTEAQLVDYAARVSVASDARPPSPHEWVYIKTEDADSTAGSGGSLFGPPDKRFIGLQWIRADRREYASFSRTIPASLPPAAVVRGTISVSPGGGGTLGGWKSVSYPYLNSLPTDPAKLAAVILADNNPRMPWYSSQSNVAVFNAIQALLLGQMQGVWIPPKLAASMYQLLQGLPGVHFDSAADLAGRTGLGLYLVLDGWYKQELVINPVTYTFMGAKTVATRAHTSVATDGTRYFHKGQVLGWTALLEEAIVRRAGQLP